MKSGKVFKFFKKLYPDKSPRRATAHALGLTPSAIYQWGEDVPAGSQMLVELASAGKIKRDK